MKVVKIGTRREDLVIVAEERRRNWSKNVTCWNCGSELLLEWDDVFHEMRVHHGGVTKLDYDFGGYELDTRVHEDWSLRCLCAHCGVEVTFKTDCLPRNSYELAKAQSEYEWWPSRKEWHAKHGSGSGKSEKGDKK